MNHWQRFSLAWVLPFVIGLGGSRHAHAQDQTQVTSPQTVTATAPQHFDASEVDEDKERTTQRERQAEEKTRRVMQVGGGLALGSYAGIVILETTVLVTPYLLKTLLGDDNSSSDSSTSSLDNPKTSHLLPVYVPLVGPFWTLSYADVRKAKGSWFWFGLSGAGQAVGTAVFLVGVCMTPDKPAAKAVFGMSLFPLVDAQGTRVIAVVGRF